MLQDGYLLFLLKRSIDVFAVFFMCLSFIGNYYYNFIEIKAKKKI
jgi:hypothetical protein